MPTVLQTALLLAVVGAGNGAVSPNAVTQAIAAVLRRVKGRQVRGLVVLRHGEIVGIFPASDTPSAVVANLEGARSELRGRGVG